MDTKISYECDNPKCNMYGQLVPHDHECEEECE